MSNTLPTYDLQLRAADERRRLHGSVTELKVRVREKMDLQRNAREHVISGSAAAGFISLVFGYAIAGMFTRH